MPLPWFLLPEGRLPWCLQGADRVWSQAEHAGRAALQTDGRTGQTHRPASAVSTHVTVDLEAGWVVSGEDRVDTIILLSTQENIQAVPGPRA